MNIIITGGSTGIGKQTALYLAADKSNIVLITGRVEKSLAKVSSSAENRNISYIVSDFSTLHQSIGVLKSKVISLIGSVDILINNAGCLHAKDFADTTMDEAKEMMEVNFFAPALIIRTLIPYINKGGHIVNISSMGGFQGSEKFRGLSYYSASKAALSCLSECLAKELKETGISINCLALGSVQTEMLKSAFPGYVAPVSASDMGRYIGNFALTGNRFQNGKVIPVALSTP
jgi:short-subunit dehydrogenase